MKVLLLLCFIPISLARLLGVYNIDPNGISTSGISSGACMATQMHVAYSSTFMAVGMIAGAPWYCAENGAIRGLRCMDTPGYTEPQFLASETIRFQNNGWIDATSNMLGDRVYVYQGLIDSVVLNGVGQHVVSYYDNFVSGADIEFVNAIDAEHGFPTMDIGSPCNMLDPEYINRCLYNGAYHILAHAYRGNVQRPIGPVPLVGDLYLFEQGEFFDISFPIQSSMDSHGYVYVPSGCVTGARTCRLHVAFHGCEQGRHRINDSFVMKSGYNEVGELNDIIILYPQAVDTAVTNPFGCWDWWGYNNAFYARQVGNQVLAVHRMVEKMAF